jgi:alkanesulfonate monooxygenase SsuD/methylene tetrahydromethanopterin reductase-like flavin-dependent oxidoreductase (luciferase family)
MKFHFFHLMPYPYLPDDFRQRVRSVWVDVPIDYYDPVKGHEVYHTYLDELMYADELGFDGICVNEHHQNAYGLMPSPNLMGAIMARESKQAKIVVMGNSVALYNPPTRVAEEFAMLDVLSGGRLVAGFPVGTPMDSNFCYGIPPAILREKYREGVGLITRAWEEREPFAFNGKYTQLRYVNIWPRPIQQPRPPVWIPGGGSVETWEFCIRNHFNYSYLSYFGYQGAKDVMKGYWDTVSNLGAEPNPYSAGFLQFVGVAESDAEAEKLYAPAALYFYNKCLHLFPGFVQPPGYSSMETVRRRIQSQIAGAAALSPDLTWKDILDRGYVVAGSPETVIDRLQDAADTLRMGHLMVLLHFGNMKQEIVRYNSELFAREVMPKLSGLFSDWEDEYWPAPSPIGPVTR